MNDFSAAKVSLIDNTGYFGRIGHGCTGGYRKTYYLSGKALCDRQRAMCQICITRLTMRGHGVMDVSVHSPFGKFLPELIPLSACDPYHILMPYVVCDF